LHSTVNTRVICLYVYLWFINDASKWSRMIVLLMKNKFERMWCLSGLVLCIIPVFNRGGWERGTTNSSIMKSGLRGEIWTRNFTGTKQECQLLDLDVRWDNWGRKKPLKIRKIR
jgi:hypothetical protein